MLTYDWVTIWFNLFRRFAGFQTNLRQTGNPNIWYQMSHKSTSTQVEPCYSKLRICHQQLLRRSNNTEGKHAEESHEHAHRGRSVLPLPALSEPPPSPTNLCSANLLWNLKNLICQHVSIICSITVRAGGRGQRPKGGLDWGWCIRGVTCCRAKAAALRWEDGAVIRPSRWLELSWTA